MNIDDLTVKQVRELCGLVDPGHRAKADAKPFPFKAGDAVYIRTVTHHLTGRLTDVGRDWFRLEEAAWIADTGRFADWLAKGPPSNAEIEPIPDFVVVGRGALIDMYPWKHDLPKTQK